MQKLWPQTCQMDDRGEVWLGGCAASALAAAHGTPLYVFDEATLTGAVAAYRSALARAYPGSAQIAYASKAFLCTALAQLWAREGLDLDVVSGGELAIALAAGLPASRIHFHGNNKTPAELIEALNAGIGRIVVDNFQELATLGRLAGQRGGPAISIWLRIAPGVQAHTHAHIQTGQDDTKFGFTLSSGDAERAVALALATPGLKLLGVHAHIGSQIYEPESLAASAARLVHFAAVMRDLHGFTLAELSPGGGWGVPMVADDPDVPTAVYVDALAQGVTQACRAAGLPLPHLVLEPGRSLVARAAVALYRVGARKEIPGVRTYVSLDGGMADNIRPALYGAHYTAHRIPAQDVPAEQIAARLAEPSEVVTLAGKFCESGDVLIRDVSLPRLASGDLVALPMAGAYTLSMASNYNMARRPAVLLVAGGGARLIQRRETYADLAARDLELTAASQHAGRFVKYQALGNDYIVLDPADWPVPPTADQVQRICDRHYGAGSDGVLWGPLPVDQVPGPTPAHVPDGMPLFGLRLYNPDGGEFEKSGNGLRIFARYLWDRRLPGSPHFAIHTPGGTVVAHMLDDAGSRVRMEMGKVSFDSMALGMAGPSRAMVDQEVTVSGRALRITAVTIGNPHCVVMMDDPLSDWMNSYGGLCAQAARLVGPWLETLPLYPQRTNVQFAQVLDRHTVRIEIWERGAGYTLASGTSSCAAASAAVRLGRCASPVTVRMPGGSMQVEITDDWMVSLTGNVAPVCRGEMIA